MNTDLIPMTEMVTFLLPTIPCFANILELHSQIQGCLGTQHLQHGHGIFFGPEQPVPICTMGTRRDWDMY